MNEGIIKDTYDFCIFLHEKMASCIFITRELLYILLFLFLIWLVYFKNKKYIGGKNIVNGIDKMYFINLDRSEDRLEYMNTEAKKINLNLIRYPAVYGKDVDEKSLIKEGVLDKNHKLTQGQLGCYLSHLGILNKAHNDNDNIIIVLEDDIKFMKGFNKRLNKYYKEVPSDWDIIYLGGSRLRGRKISEHVVKGVYEKEITGEYNMGTYGMMISKKGIKKLLNCLYPIIKPIDMAISLHNKDLNIYFVNPSIISHNNNFKSEIKFLDENIEYSYHNDETPTKIEIISGGEKNIHTYSNNITNIKKKVVGMETSLFSIPLFYINLDKDIERNKYMERILDRFKIDATRIEGIYGKTYNKNYIEVNNKKYYFALDTMQPPTSGEIGTCLSHIKAIISMKDRGDDYGIICEDDLEFSLLNKYKEIINLEKIIKEAPNNWEMIKLHTSNPKVLNKLSNEFYNNKLYSKIKTLKTENYSMMAYIINKKYIESFFNKYYIDGIFIFNGGHFISDVTLLFSENMYNYTVPIFKSKIFISSRLSKINKFDYESNKIINQFWVNLIKNKT